MPYWESGFSGIFSKQTSWSSHWLSLISLIKFILTQHCLIFLKCLFFLFSEGKDSVVTAESCPPAFQFDSPDPFSRFLTFLQSNVTGIWYLRWETSVMRRMCGWRKEPNRVIWTEPRAWISCCVFSCSNRQLSFCACVHFSCRTYFWAEMNWKICLVTLCLRNVKHVHMCDCSNVSSSLTSFWQRSDTNNFQQRPQANTLLFSGQGTGPGTLTFWR